MFEGCGLAPPMAPCMRNDTYVMNLLNQEKALEGDVSYLQYPVTS